MSDFQDFLKRNYASVVRGEFKPGKFAAMQQLYTEAIATYGDGFRGAYLLQEPGTDRGVSIILWESLDNMTEQQTPEYESILEKMKPLFATAPTTTLYELVGEFHH
jgi:heme-degrading monooxygenase HmoA